MIYHFHIPASLSVTLFTVIVIAAIAFAVLVVAGVLLRLLWEVFREPAKEMYFDWLDYKEKREKTKYSRKSKKKTQWYDDYSTFR